MPLAEAATSSLEALKAFSLGRQNGQSGDSRSALRYEKRAVELDPNFAYACRAISVYYTNLAEWGEPMSEAASKALELRGRASELERLLIEAQYYEVVANEQDRVTEALETATQTYPRSQVAWHSLGWQYRNIGQDEKAIAALRESVRLSPTVPSYVVLASTLFYLDRFMEIKELCLQTLAQKVEPETCPADLFQIAFLEGDGAGMKRQVERANALPNPVRVWSWQRDAALAHGRLRQAREFTQKGIRFNRSRNAKSPGFLGTMAVYEAVVGNCAQSEEAGRAALEPGTNSATVVAAALCRDRDRTSSMADEMSKHFPKNFMSVNTAFLPCLRALANGDALPAAAREFRVNNSGDVGGLPLAYCRGEVYLAQRMGAEAAPEFQKI